MDATALKHLTKADPVLGRVIKSVGPCTLTPESARSPFESLVRAVSHQQLHGKAAESILKRFLACFPGRRFPRPADLAAVSDEAMRSAGFSGAKVAAIRDIAAKTIEGIVPGPRAIKNMPDEEIIERLTMVRGVGRWTVEMLLIFQLGRPDVLPADDFGVRNGFRRAYGLPEMPKPKELLAHGARWAPYRTTAAWYLWRAADDAVAQGL
jgi:DNA-3-methyladenine glycosylase II